MLRESAVNQDLTVNLMAVRRGGFDPGIPLGREILAMVDASVLGDPDELPIARAVLRAAAGDDVVERVAAVSANFEMMNRLLDATGAPVASPGGIVEQLELDVPAHLAP